MILPPIQVFQTSWRTQAQILTDAVDDIVAVEDFLFVSESHILEDVNRSEGKLVFYIIHHVCILSGVA